MATKANINIDQGSSFNTEIDLTDDAGNPLDLSAYTATAQMRKSYTSINAISFGTTLSNGAILLTMNAETTSQIVAGRYLYDVVMEDGQGTVTRIVEGQVTVTPGITRTSPIQYYYTITLANVQHTIYAGDLVYQSNGSANVTGYVYESDGPFYGKPSNTVIIKVTDTVGTFEVSNTHALFDSNTNANGMIISIKQDVTR